VARSQALSFARLSPSDFEEFCFDLLHELGFVNIDWRKGTGLTASPSDRGRDIVCQWERVDVDGTKHLDTWFVDCKHFTEGVPPERIQGLLTWAESERPKTALIIASRFLSNAAKDNIESYKRNRRPPFEIRFWENPQLRKMVGKRRTLLSSYGLVTDTRRSLKAIIAAEQEMYDKRWYDRHAMTKANIESGRTKIDPGIWRRALRAGKEVEKRYGKKNLGPYSDFEWGILAGKHAALRWVLGDDWDNYDT